jgi:hypothetical protein
MSCTSDESLAVVFWLRFLAIGAYWISPSWILCFWISPSWILCFFSGLLVAVSCNQSILDLPFVDSLFLAAYSAHTHNCQGTLMTKGISMAQKRPRKAAHSSLGGLPTSNLGTQKAQAHMLPNCCHGARARIWSQREWLAALELPAFPWRKKGRARPTTALLVDFLPQI